jgi:hypothetical protein
VDLQTTRDIATIYSVIASTIIPILMWLFYWGGFFRRPKILSWQYNPTEMGPESDGTIEIHVFNKNIRTNIEIRGAFLRRWFRSYPITLDWLNRLPTPDTCETIVIQYPIILSLRENVVFVEFNQKYLSQKKIYGKKAKIFLIANNGRKSNPIRLRLFSLDDAISFGKTHK